MAGDNGLRRLGLGDLEAALFGHEINDFFLFKAPPPANSPKLNAVVLAH
jgi:hypothetical protein